MQAIEFHWKIINTICRFRAQTEHVIQPFCSENDITPLQFHILLALYFEGPQTVSGLARQTCMAGANASVLCKRMAGQNYLVRKRDEMDERQVVIHLEPKGELLVKRFSQHCQEGYCAWKKQFTQEEIDVIMQGFNQFLAVIEENDNKEIGK